MALKYADFVTARKTPQTQPVDDTQVRNNAGGYVYALDCWKQLRRFLILGSEGGTYYVRERELTLDNVKCVQDCLTQDVARTVAEIVKVSTGGLAPKQGPAIFALALAAAAPNKEDRVHAYRALGSVCRTGTHLFTFVDAVNKVRGWSRGLCRAVGGWYLDKPADKLAYQLLKYKNREGWTHRDVLRLAHPKPKGVAHNALFNWACGKESTATKANEHLPMQVIAAETAHVPKITEAAQVGLIRHYKLTHEMLPTESLKSKAVWDALLHDMPVTAVVRNLGRMTSLGLLSKGSAASNYVCALLQNADVLQKGRVHPLALLNAQRVYARGHGDKGSLSWTANKHIVEALDAAFYLAFKNVEPTGKRVCLAIDGSGSMQGATIAGTGMSAFEAAVALALVTARTEPNHHICIFDTQLVHVRIKETATLPSLLSDLRNVWKGGGTDCAKPIVEATRQRVPFDVFIEYTDNETWAGTPHPSQALKIYREQLVPNAKLVVCGMTSTGFTIADPKDPGMLDVVGFSTDVPNLITEFVKE